MKSSNHRERAHTTTPPAETAAEAKVVRERLGGPRAGSLPERRRGCALSFLLSIATLTLARTSGAQARALVGGPPAAQVNRVYVYISTEEGGTFYCDGIQPKCGGTPPLFGSIEGTLETADPIDACQSLNSTAKDEMVFAIVQRGGCNTTLKAANAQAAGYLAAIIYDDKDEPLMSMWEDLGWAVVGIPIVFVSQNSGKSVTTLLQQPGPRCSISDTWAPLRKVVLIVIAWLFMQVVVNVWNGLLPPVNTRHEPIQRAPRPRWDPKSLPVFLYESTDDGAKSEDSRTCTICFEDYEDGDPIRLLPCQHGFHTECIDPWFSRDRLQCPMCKHPANHPTNSPRSEDGHYIAPAPWSPIHPSSPRSPMSQQASPSRIPPRYDPFASSSPTPRGPATPMVPLVRDISFNSISSSSEGEQSP